MENQPRVALRRRLFSLALCVLFGATLLEKVPQMSKGLSATERLRLTGAAESLASGVLVRDFGPRFVAPGWPAGLWHVAPTGETTKLVGRRWRVEAWHPTSEALIRQRNDQDTEPFKYALLHGDEITPLDLDREDVSCSGWSTDGRLLTYLTGELRYYTTFSNGNLAYGVDGELWVAHRTSPNQPVLIADGLFPECPVWSTTDRSLAYLIQGDTEKTWEMRLYEGHRTDVLKEFRLHAPSMLGPDMNRTFDFSMEGDLFFLARRSIYVASSGGVTRFGPAGILKELRDPELRGWQRFVRALRVSPSSGLVGATIDDETTLIVDPDEVLRVVPNRLRGWAGNHGVVTFGITEDRPAADLYPVDPSGSTRRLRNALKVGIYADAEGEWFAHNVGLGRPRVIWRNPDGSIGSVTELGFRGWIMASIDGGVIDRAVVP